MITTTSLSSNHHHRTILLLLLLAVTPIIDGAAAAGKNRAIGQNVILLLIDGFANSFLNDSRSSLYGLKAMADNGVQADYLKPSFPTLSYPNWYSLVTGLYVENHGMTGNFMYDIESGMQFAIGRGENDTNQLWWSVSEPLWYIAGRSGNVSVHCYFWDGCQIPHKDLVVNVPTERRLNGSEPKQTERLPDYFDQIIAQIERYQPYRKQLFIAYYASLDYAAHIYGPDSDQAHKEMLKADVIVSDLQQRLAAANLFDTTNLIVLSDHGQMTLEREEQFFIEECLSDYSKIKYIVDSYAMMLVFTDATDVDEVYFELKVCDQWAPMADYDDHGNDQPLIGVYRTADLPDRYNFKRSRFLPSIVLIARPGASVLTRELPSIPPAEYAINNFVGNHGWDNEHPDMHAVFFARGPAFKHDYRARWLNMVDVYQLVLNILGLRSPHAHNGTWDHVKDMLDDGFIASNPRADDYQGASGDSVYFCTHSIATTVALISILWILLMPYRFTL